MMLAAALILLTAGLAAANGANDVSKGIATLVGSGVSDYRRAVIWGTLWTMLGAVVAAFASQALVRTFTGSGLVRGEVSSPEILLAVACGAVGWLIVATGTGLPISTTHSLAGALLGATTVAFGAGGVLWSSVAMKIAIPLLASPLLAVALVLIVLPVLRPFIERIDRYCLCVEQKDSLAIGAYGVAVRSSLGPTTRLGSESSCSESVARIDGIDLLHWVSAGATSFFRGLNDAPKVLAIGIGAALTIGLSAIGLYTLVAAAMGLGSLVAGFRVTQTLARKITPISPSNGLAANLVTSILVGLASVFALPVSTTHVSSGAVLGVAASRGGRDVRSRTVRDMLLAWLVTLPLSALLAAAVYTAVI